MVVGNDISRGARDVPQVLDASLLEPLYTIGIIPGTCWIYIKKNKKKLAIFFFQNPARFFKNHGILKKNSAISLSLPNDCEILPDFFFQIFWLPFYCTKVLRFLQKTFYSTPCPCLLAQDDYRKDKRCRNRIKFLLLPQSATNRRPHKKIACVNPSVFMNTKEHSIETTLWRLGTNYSC